MLTLSLHSRANAIDDVHIIPFVKSAGLIIIEAEVDGQIGNFIFDTGADALLLNQGRKVKTKSEQVFYSLNGTFVSNSIQVSHLSLGTYTASSLTAYGTDLSQFEEILGNSILGVIGANVFNAEVLRIDNIKKTIELLPKRLLPNLNKSQKYSCAITFDNDIPIIEVNINGEMCYFGLDTGSSTSLLDKRFILAHPEIFESNLSNINLLTANNNSKSIKSVKSLVPISLANIQINDVSFAAFDFESINTTFDKPILGILSIDNLPLKELFLDYKDNHIYFLF